MTMNAAGTRVCAQRVLCMLMVVYMARTSALTVKQFSSCSADVGGKVLNLEPLDRYDNSRFVYSESSEAQTGSTEWNYMYSPCHEFNKPEDPYKGFGDKCRAVALCKYGEAGKREYYYTLGFHRNAKFLVDQTPDNETEIKLLYQGYRSMEGKTTAVKLVCDRSRTTQNDVLFRIVQDEKRLGDVEAELHHVCCCLDGCKDDIDGNKHPMQAGNRDEGRSTGENNQNITHEGNNTDSGAVSDRSSHGANRSDTDTVVSEMIDPSEKKDKTKADRTKVMIIVGVNFFVILMAGAVGFMCYNKRTHLEIYHKLPGVRSAPEPSLWQLANSADLLEKGSNAGPISSMSLKGTNSAPADKSGYRDGAPNVRRKSLCMPVLEHAGIPEECITMGQRLGGGIFGDTYLGEWTGLTVAIKRITLSVHKHQINHENIKDLQEQVTYLSHQRHRNIVSVLGYCSESKHPYIITEYMTGQVMKDFIKQSGSQLLWPHRVKILSQVADGMAFLHSTKPPILHRDLRCGNMFITTNDAIKICDFGIVNLTQPLRAVCQVADCCCQGLYSSCPPSIGWTAPEVLEHPNSSESDGYITMAADVYSFAIVMWELVMGDDPYEDIATTPEVIEHVLGGGRPEIPRHSAILPSYIELMKKCWDANPQDRYSFKQITVHLKEIHHQARVFQKALNNKHSRQKTTSKTITFSSETKLAN